MRIKVEDPLRLKVQLTKRRLVLYGMGTIGMEISQWLDQTGIPYTYADKSAQAKQEATGKHVVTPEVVISEYRDASIIVATNVYFDEIRNNLLAHGFRDDQILSYALFIPSEIVWTDLEDSIDWSQMRPSVELFSRWLDENDRSVADYGAGQMYLKTFLHEGTDYYPVDYLKRFEETIVCDLNTGVFPNLEVDVAVLNGVLEYLTTAEALLKHACNRCSKKVILSYVTVDRFPNIEARRASGYISDLTEETVIRILEGSGFHLIKSAPDPLHPIGTIYLFTREPPGAAMKYACFKDADRTSVNIGDYLQFMTAKYLLRLMNVPEEDIIYLGFRDLAEYDGAPVVFPFCYSIRDFVSNGRINISDRIKPVLLSVTLSTVDKFMDVDCFLEDEYNHSWLLKHSPIGCRDEITWDMLTRHQIPAYINGCMTAILPGCAERPGDKVLFVDAPKALLPYIPDAILENCEFSTQQYYFKRSDVEDYKSMFAFVTEKYETYRKTAKLVITSRLHVALPLTAIGIPVILAKDYVDGRFSFVERYLPIYGKERYQEIDWTPCVPDMTEIKKLLVMHALGRIQNNIPESELHRMERELTRWFQTRTVRNKYLPSHMVTHANGQRFDTYAAKYWKKDEPIRYALWGVNENNSDYWKKHIESRYPRAELAAVFDSFREGEIFGTPYQRPEMIAHCPDLYVIVCSVGAAQAAQKLFGTWALGPERYCIVSNCFIRREDIGGEHTIAIQ